MRRVRCRCSQIVAALPFRAVRCTCRYLIACTTRTMYDVVSIALFLTSCFRVPLSADRTPFVIYHYFCTVVCCIIPKHGQTHTAAADSIKARCVTEHPAARSQRLLQLRRHHHYSYCAACCRAMGPTPSRFHAQQDTTAEPAAAEA